MATTHIDLDDVDGLSQRMDRIRGASRIHVADMQTEAGRLVDWREHVRAKPLVAVAAAVLVGFSLVSRKLKPDTPPLQSPDLCSSTTQRSSLASSVFSVAGSMAGNMIRNYVTSYVREKLIGELHDLKFTPGESSVDRMERKRFTH